MYRSNDIPRIVGVLGLWFVAIAPLVPFVPSVRSVLAAGVIWGLVPFAAVGAVLLANQLDRSDQ